MYEGVTHDDIKMLIKRFPEASKRFLEINGLECGADAEVRPFAARQSPKPLDAPVSPAKPQPPTRAALEPSIERLSRGETGIACRVVVHFTLYKCRLFDSDNAHASVKTLLDALRYSRIIENDTTRDIALIVDQVRVKHRHLGGVGVVVTYPMQNSPYRPNTV